MPISEVVTPETGQIRLLRADENHDSFSREWRTCRKSHGPAAGPVAVRSLARKSGWWRWWWRRWAPVVLPARPGPAELAGLGGVQMAVRVSIGVAFNRSDDADTDRLLSDVDAAMYAAKSSGKGGTGPSPGAQAVVQHRLSPPAARA